MTSVDLIRRLHQHRTWVNQRVLNACEPLTEDQFRQSFAIGQGTIWQTLLHLYAAEWVWLSALQGNPDPLTPGDLPGQLPGNQKGDNPITSFAILKECWADLDQRWSEYLAQIRDEDLSKPVEKISTSSGKGKTHVTAASDVLLHLCTHAQYTTAQLINMLRHAGVEQLPDVMLITLARQSGSPSGE